MSQRAQKREIARFSLRTELLVPSLDTSPPPPSPSNPNPNPNPILVELLKAIENNASASFGITKLLSPSHLPLLNALHPTSLLNLGRIKRGIISRWHTNTLRRGGDRGRAEASREVDKVLDYLRREQSISPISYSILLDTYGVTACLIKAGADYTLTSSTSSLSPSQNVILRSWTLDSVWVNFSVFVLKILKACRIDFAPSTPSVKCQICSFANSSLQWSAPCEHKVCERCFFEKLITDRDTLTEVCCPVPSCCCRHVLSKTNFDNNSDDYSELDSSLSPRAKYDLLPLDLDEFPKSAAQSQAEAPKRPHQAITNIPYDSHKVSPWKNGLGSTREIAVSSTTPFQWRISSAAVTSSGPFSDFANYTRHLTILPDKAGCGGMELTVGTLVEPLEIIKFDGGVKCDCRLLGTRLTDFNVFSLTDTIDAIVDVVEGGGSSVGLFTRITRKDRRVSVAFFYDVGSGNCVRVDNPVWNFKLELAESGGKCIRVVFMEKNHKPKYYQPKGVQKEKKNNKKFTLMHDLSKLPKSKLQSALGSYKGKRDERFMQAVNDGYSVRHLRLFLQYGVNVNLVNEYSQTALMIACWFNNFEVAKFLVEEGGGDVHHRDLLGLTAYDVTASEEIRRLLEGAGARASGRAEKNEFLLQAEAGAKIEIEKIPTLEYLVEQIQPNPHPSADACVIIDTLSPDMLSSVNKLVNFLPVSSCVKEKSGDVVCSDRKYYCDMTNILRKTIEKSVEIAFGGNKQCVVLPHFRILSYAEAGVGLPPHIDLCRIDPLLRIVGEVKRSTHTVIIYTTSFEDGDGGETVIMKKLRVKEGEGEDENDLAVVGIVAGKMLLFRHHCPHRANPGKRGGKVLLRGELYFK